MKPGCLFRALRPSPAALPARRNDAMAVSLRMLAALSFLLLSASGGWAQFHHVLICEDPAGTCKAVGCGRDYQEANLACARLCHKACLRKPGANCPQNRDFLRWSYDLKYTHDAASTCPIAETPMQRRWDAASHAERKKLVQENPGVHSELLAHQRTEFDLIKVELQRDDGERVCQQAFKMSCQEAVRRGLN